MADNELITTCQALTNKGLPCGQPTLPSYPFCYHHIKPPTVSKRHDRYGDVMPPVLHPHYQHQLRDDRPKDLTEEISYLRTIVRQRFEKLQTEGQEAGGQITGEDILAVIQLTEAIGRTVERQAKVQPERVVTVPDILAIITKIIDVINEQIPKEQLDIRNRIVGGIQRQVTDLLSSATEFTYGSNPQ